MKCLFVVQGEGRGHMTQAIALRQRLEEAGHEVCLTMVGVSRFRTLPDFFAQRMKGPVMTFESPVLVTDRHDKGVSFARTAVHSFLSFPRFTLSVFRIRKEISRHRPDVVVNFFDLMCSISFLLRLRRPRHVCVGHQFYFQHPDFIRPQTSLLGDLAFRLLTRCSAFRADLRLALSFRPGKPSWRGLRVVAPILRSEVLKAEAHEGSHWSLICSTPAMPSKSKIGVVGTGMWWFTDSGIVLEQPQRPYSGPGSRSMRWTTESSWSSSRAAERSSPRRDSNRCVKPCTSENPCSWSRRQGTWSSITMRATLSPPGGACSRTTSIRACSSRIGPTERP